MQIAVLCYLSANIDPTSIQTSGKSIDIDRNQYNQQVTMEFHKHLWKSLEVNVNHLTSIEIDRNLWKSMDIN